MKLLGKVTEVDRRVAKNRGDTFEEKRGFKIELRPAARTDAYFGYGSMNFYLNGRELEDFPVDLNDKVDVYLVKSGTEERPLEDTKRELYEALRKVDDLTREKELFSRQSAEFTRIRNDLSMRLDAMTKENARLLAQQAALEMARGTDPHIRTIEYDKPE